MLCACPDVCLRVCAARHHVCDSGSYSAAAATCWQKHASLSVFKWDLLQQIMLPIETLQEGLFTFFIRAAATQTARAH